MTQFLEALGDELDGAAARIVAGERVTRRRVPWRVVLPAAVAVAAAVLIAVLAGGPPARPTALPAPRPAAPLPTPTVGDIVRFPGAAPPALRDVPVGVLNGTTIVGLATHYATQLRGRAWRTPRRVGNYYEQTVATSFVAYGTGDQQATAQAVARALGIRRVVQNPEAVRLRGGHVTVVLGADAG